MRLGLWWKEIQLIKNNGKPWVVLVIDNSDSMRKHGDQVENAITNLRRQISDKCNLAVARFSHEYHGLLVNQQDYPRYGGDTALYQSMARTLQELESVHGLDAHNKVFCAIITDGADNCGGVTTHQVAAEVRIAENLKGWDFLYVGTCQKANEVGTLCGVKTGKSLSFANTEKGFDHMLSSLTNTIDRWIGGQITHDADFFTAQMQQEQVALGARI